MFNTRFSEIAIFAALTSTTMTTATVAGDV
jgi:hypothetical protein